MQQIYGPKGTYPTPTYGQQYYSQNPYYASATPATANAPLNAYGPTYYGAPAPSTPYPTHNAMPGPNFGAEQPAAPMARPKKYSRRSTTYPNEYPIKSAMKPRPAEEGEKQLKRRNTEGQAEAQTRMPNLNLLRPRTYSNPTHRDRDSGFVPLHIFVSFHRSDELRIEHVTEDALKDLRDTIKPIWPYGHSDEVVDTTWQVRFANSPWSSRGNEALLAYDIIIAVFTLFTRRGFWYLTSMDTASPPPRLIFSARRIDNTAHFFLGYFSRSGHRLTLVKPPPHIGASIGTEIRRVLPLTVESEHMGDKRVIELKTNAFRAPIVEKPRFIMHVLKIIQEMGYRLEATVPMARGGPLGLGPRKELFVFRGVRSS